MSEQLVMTRKAARDARRPVVTRPVKRSWYRAVARMMGLPTKKKTPKVPSEPGRRGWAFGGGGETANVDAPPEVRGPGVQVCGLYPFSAGSSLPMVGTPLGPHLGGRGTVCADPVSLFVEGMINNPSAFVLGQPGLGKSSLIRHIVAQLPDKGILPMILADLKPDYVDLMAPDKLNGQIISVGRGRENVNPFDLGPLAPLLAQLPDELRLVAQADLEGRRKNVVSGLCELALNAQLQAHEEHILTAAMRAWDEQHSEPPVAYQIRELIAAGSTVLSAIAQDRGSRKRYLNRVERLLDSLLALEEGGAFGDTFARPTSTAIDLDRPVVFDMSGVEAGDTRLQAGLQLVCWSYGSAAIGAAMWLAKAGLRPRRTYLVVMDELWRALRAAPFMVDRVDELTRLNRQLNLGQILCTHTMNDLKLGTAEATAKAWGFVERSELVFLGGLAPGEMGNLAEAFDMSQVEKDMVTGWSASGKVNPETGEVDAPPGRGKFLMKQGKDIGTPFRVQLVAAEIAVNDTNKSWKDTIDSMRRTRAFEDELLDVS